MAVGNFGAISDAQTSFDGITWTAQRSTMGNAMFGASWSGTTFLAVGEASAYMTSPDGITWTGYFDSVSADDLNGVTFFANRFIAVGTSGKILTSP